MGTHTSDVLYMGLCHSAPPRVLSPRRERLIAARWLEWAPFVLMQIRAGAESKSLEWFRLHHHTVALAVLDAGVKWKIMLRRRLDDPLLSNNDRAVAIKLAQFKQRAHLHCGQFPTGRKIHKGDHYASSK